MDKKQQSLIYIHLAVFLWGFTAVLGKLININSIVLVWLRSFLSVIIILPFTISSFIHLYKNNRKYFLYAVGTGIVLGLHWLCFYESLRLSNISISVICLSTMAFSTCFIDLILFKKKITLQKTLISLLGFLGLFLMFKMETKFRLGILIGFIGSVLSALYVCVNKKILKEVKPFSLMSLQLVVVFIFLGVSFLFLQDRIDFRLESIGLIEISLLFILASVCTILPFYLALFSLQYVSSFTQNVIVNLEPVYAVSMAFIFFNERAQFGYGFFIGLSILLVSVIIQTYIDSRNKNKRG